MKVEDSKKQAIAAKKEVEQFIKKLGLMTNRDALKHLKATYPALYSTLEDRLIEAVMILPDVSYLE